MLFNRLHQPPEHCRCGNHIVSQPRHENFAGRKLLQHLRQTANMVRMGMGRNDQIQPFHPGGLQIIADRLSLVPLPGINQHRFVPCLNQNTVTLPHINHVDRRCLLPIQLDSRTIRFFHTKDIAPAGHVKGKPAHFAHGHQGEKRHDQHCHRQK